MNFCTEILEARRLLAITVTGTGAADVIRIAADGANVLIVVNGASSRFAADPEGIIVNAGDGADTLRLDDASSLPVTLNGGPADDRFEVGGGDVRAARLASVDVVGNAGNDTLIVDDSLAATANPAVSIDNPIDTYVSIVAAPGSIIRSDASNATNAVETITYSGTAQGDSVFVHGTNALTTLLVNGGNGNDTVTVGQDLDTMLKGPTSLDGQGGADVLTFDDSADLSLSDSYFLAGTATVGTMRKSSGGSTASFTSFSNVSIIAGAAGAVPNTQFFRVTSLPDAISTTFFGGNGDDTLFFGDGVATLDTFKSNLTFDGGDGIDSIVYNDVVGVDAASYTVNPTSITNTGTATLNFINSESVLLTANSASNDVRVNATTPDLSVTVNGGVGNDTLRVGNGDFDATILDGVSVIGGAGTDTLIIDDTLDNPGNDTYAFGTGPLPNSDMMTKGDMVAFWSTATADRVESVSLLAGANADTIRINNFAPTIKFNIDAGGGDDSIFVASTTEGTAAPAAVTIVSGSGNDAIDVNSDLAGSDALVAFVSPVEEFKDVTVRAGGRATIASGPSGILAVHGALTVSGRLDVADATMIVNAGNFAATDALATAGYAGGTWTGGASAAAIVSATAAASTITDAVAVVRATDLALPAFSGFQTTAGDVIVRYTLSGDANLDRAVDFSDLTVLAQNYGSTGQTWAQGDFNFDANGAVDFDDLVALAQNYSSRLPAARSTMSSAVVTTHQPTTKRSSR